MRNLHINCIKCNLFLFRPLLEQTGVDWSGLDMTVGQSSFSEGGMAMGMGGAISRGHSIFDGKLDMRCINVIAATLS